MINRAALDEILLDHGISRERLASLKIKLKEGRGPHPNFLYRLFRPERRVVGRYHPPELKDRYSPEYKAQEAISLWPEEIEQRDDKSLGGVLAHECSHMIVGVGRQSIDDPLALLPVWGHHHSPDEVAAREKVAELLKDPRWNQVISSDS